MSTETLEKPVETDDRIVCHIDNVRVHSVQMHIKNHHAEDWSVDRYKKEFPNQPLLSKTAQAMLNKAAKNKAVTKEAPSTSSIAVAAATNMPLSTMTTGLAEFHEVFGLGNVAAAKSSLGRPISIEVYSGHDAESLNYLPDVDVDYVYNIDLLKKVILGYRMNMPTYLWGMHGTGKTTLLQQAAARIKQPFLRVQHTIGTQESDVLGQWTVRDGSTFFQLGPLAQAMIMGWIYCADEYDFAMPSVSAVYQPVLEGQALLIKDAPIEFRKIVPHKNFRFVATGNTNGVGDETGLYQGTLVQNAANYSRFKITEEVKYMSEKQEIAILRGKMRIEPDDAKKIVKFANGIRDMFESSKISMTISPREILSAVEIGVAYGGNWPEGLKSAFANRLGRVDRKVVCEYMDRLF